MKAIEARGLTKSYNGARAVDRLDLEVEEGSVFGFLGPNGAGKTTTIRMLVGLARPTAGSATILGLDAASKRDEIARRIGYLPEVPAFYAWMTGPEYLHFCGELFGLSRHKRNERIGRLLQLAGLENVGKPIGAYSRGMKQRLGIAQALVNKPAVLFLDEPTSALDPLGRREVLEMVRALGKEKTVFFSTHILADVERACDTVAVINDGRLVLQSDLATLKQRYMDPVFSVEFDGPSEAFEAKLAGVPWIVEVSRDERGLAVRTNDLAQAQTQLPLLVAQSGLPLRQLQLRELTLEDIFVRVLR